MGIAIRNFYRKTVDQVIANDTLISVGLSSPVAKNETQKLRWWLPFSVGATGGAQFIIVTPSGANVKSTIKLYDPTNDVIHIGYQDNVDLALAGATDCWIEVEALIVNGANVGVLELQASQHATDALTLSIPSGATLDVTKG